MAAFAVDSNCLVASVSQGDARQAVRGEIDRRLAAGEDMLIPAHAMTEAFSVLTRRPLPLRLTPADVNALLTENFMTRGRVVALDADACSPLIARVAAADIGGGRIYDEVIAETAARAGATTLLTLNPKHFPSPPAGLRIVDPTAGLDPGMR